MLLLLDVPPTELRHMRAFAAMRSRRPPIIGHYYLADQVVLLELRILLLIMVGGRVGLEEC